MKVSVNINPNATSPSILITAKKQTAEIIYLEQKFSPSLSIQPSSLRITTITGR